MQKPGDITIVYEDKDLVAINKPAYLAVHPGFQKTNFTLLHWLNKKYPPAGSVLLLNRIDKDTSGLVLAGKNKEFINRYNTTLIKKVYKEYLVVARPMKREMKEINIPLPILYERPHTIQSACTRILSVEKLKRGLALYRVTLVTGRTHQIRRHFQLVKAPIAGDWKYGDPEVNQYFREEFGLRRQFLHAGLMKVPGFPTLVAPLPEDLENILNKLRDTKPQNTVHRTQHTEARS